MADSHSVDRRDFVLVVMTAFGAVVGGVIGIPAISYLVSPATKVQSSEAWIPVGKLESYEIGVPKPFSFTRSKQNGWEKTVNSYGVYVLRTGENEAKIISNVCTHLSCRVKWAEDTQQFKCPCHDAAFTINGEVASGPPPRPLDVYTETRLTEDGILEFFFKEG